MHVEVISFGIAVPDASISKNTSRDFVRRPFIGIPTMAAFQQGVPFSQPSYVNLFFLHMVNITFYTNDGSFQTSTHHVHANEASPKYKSSAVFVLPYLLNRLSTSRADILVHTNITVTTATSSGLIASMCKITPDIKLDRFLACMQLKRQT